MKTSEHINDGASTSAAGKTEAMQVNDAIASISTLDFIYVNYVRTPFIKDTFGNSYKSSATRVIYIDHKDTAGASRRSRLWDSRTLVSGHLIRWARAVALTHHNETDLRSDACEIRRVIVETRGQMPRMPRGALTAALFVLGSPSPGCSSDAIGRQIRTRPVFCARAPVPVAPARDAAMTCGSAPAAPVKDRLNNISVQLVRNRDLLGKQQFQRVRHTSTTTRSARPPKHFSGAPEGRGRSGESAGPAVIRGGRNYSVTCGAGAGAGTQSRRIGIPLALAPLGLQPVLAVGCGRVKRNPATSAVILCI
ncbi:hypothetical protein EVAR_87241_1 [Eumeta japonica]|uniref:Uncharacterized protein n=1 Tax=Eumeta variegata TaxID=151549 RepID=A0A4C1YPP3_EUMVA|nr:hypothetical protein EVAR_87241_1 [Eumeta japonica]